MINNLPPRDARAEELQGVSVNDLECGTDLSRIADDVTGRDLPGEGSSASSSQTHQPGYNFVSAGGPEATPQSESEAASIPVESTMLLSFFVDH
jgi:hypothetical protein